MGRRDCGGPDSLGGGEAERPGHHLLGAAFLGKKDPAQAEKAFHAALETDRKFVPALLNLGQPALQNKNLDEAERQVRLASEVAPSDLLPMFSLASVLTAQGKFPEAIQRLEAAAKLNPDLLILQLILGSLRQYGSF